MINKEEIEKLETTIEDYKLMRLNNCSYEVEGELFIILEKLIKEYKSLKLDNYEQNNIINNYIERLNVVENIANKELEKRQNLIDKLYEMQKDENSLIKQKLVGEILSILKGETEDDVCVEYSKKIDNLEARIKELEEENNVFKQANIDNSKIISGFDKENYKLNNRIKELEKERDYYKARYLEFNNVFIEGGKKLTKEEKNR